VPAWPSAGLHAVLDSFAASAPALAFSEMATLPTTRGRPRPADHFVKT
jgi:hypothetical protein